MSIPALAVTFAAIVVLVAIAKRINVAYPIVLVLGGIAIGYIPGFPRIQMPPELVLVVFLPPLLYWESVTAPTSDFRRGAWWIFQLAFGLVIVTMLAVAAVIHWLSPAMSWAAAFVLGAIVASTDEVAFVAVAERLRVPRHLVATIEGESLVNDATSLILYGVALGAVVGQSFSIVHAIGDLAISVAGAVGIGIAAGVIAVLAWRLANDDELQPVISLMVPYLAYWPAYRIGVSAVLAVVTTGIFVNRFTPRVLRPRARLRSVGFWVTNVFVVNAFIFVLVGLQFHSITSSLSAFPFWRLVVYAVAVCLTVIAVRFIWVFAQGLLPISNEPEHVKGKADWSHVTVLAWTGMRGGVSLAAALALPVATSAGVLPQRPLIIFLTFCVLLATLVVQGGALPWLLRVLHVKDDGADTREERLALAKAAKAALRKLDELHAAQQIPNQIYTALRAQFRSRWREFGPDEDESRGAASAATMYRSLERQLLDEERNELIRLRDMGKIDNTVMRRILALLDFQEARIDLLSHAGHTDLDN